jgi:hypothetical protein
MVLQWCDDATRYVEELTSEGKPNVDYVLFSLQNPKSPKPVMELFSMGKGGRAKVEELLVPETHNIITGAFLASAIEESGSVVSVRRKYIHIIWVGSSVGIIIKGKVNTSLGEPFKEKFPGCAMYLQISDGDMECLQADILEKTLMALGGAQKPTRYSFTNRTLIGSLTLDDSMNDQSRRRAEEERREADARRQVALVEQARRKAAAEQERQRLAAAAEEEAKRLLAAEEETRRQKADAERKRIVEEERRQRLLSQEEEELRKQKQKEEEEIRHRQEEEEARRRKAYLEEQEAKNKAAAMTPKAALSDQKIIMLISTMSGNLTTSANQARGKAMLEALDVVPEVVDGAVPENKDIRNELFAISGGLRGKYPLFFLRQVDGTIQFFADMDTLDYYNESRTLAQQLVGCGTPKRGATVDAAAATPPASVSTLNGKQLLLLISSMSGSVEVASSQTRLQGILKGLHLPKEEVQVLDGCDLAIKDRRNELFGISGIRAKYPQLFLVDTSTGETQFVGNFDDISYLHDTNTLAQAIGLETKSATRIGTADNTVIAVEMTSEKANSEFDFARAETKTVATEKDGDTNNDKGEIEVGNGAVGCRRGGARIASDMPVSTDTLNRDNRTPIKTVDGRAAFGSRRASFDTTNGNNLTNRAIAAAIAGSSRRGSLDSIAYCNKLFPAGGRNTTNPFSDRGGFLSHNTNGTASGGNGARTGGGNGARRDENPISKGALPGAPIGGNVSSNSSTTDQVVSTRRNSHYGPPLSTNIAGSGRRGSLDSNIYGSKLVTAGGRDTTNASSNRGNFVKRDENAIPSGTFPKAPIGGGVGNNGTTIYRDGSTRRTYNSGGC